jgi:hypothetical protein
MADAGLFRPSVIIVDGVNLDRPGIYEWRITYPDFSKQIYIGKYTRGNRPTREYRRNVERLLHGRPYRKNNPDGFRLIHRESAQAALNGREIVLTVLENVPPEDLFRRERELIESRGTLNAEVARRSSKVAAG